MSDELEQKIRVLLGIGHDVDLETMLDDAIDNKHGAPMLITQPKPETTTGGLANQDITAANYFN